MGRPSLLLQLDLDLYLDDSDAGNKHHEHTDKDILHCESVVRGARLLYGLSDFGPETTKWYPLFIRPGGFRPKPLFKV